MTSPTIDQPPAGFVNINKAVAFGNLIYSILNFYGEMMAMPDKVQNEILSSPGNCDIREKL
jgi:hypothetical protein